MNKDEQVIRSFWSIFNKRMWLDGYKMKVHLKDYSPSEIHCIEYIGKNDGANVTKLAESFDMTRSAISKLTKKMITKGLIENYQKADNKKEIYFRLTPQGKKIYDIHERLHSEILERDKTVFEQTTEEQYDNMLRFAEMYNRHLDEEIEKLGEKNNAKGLDKF